MKNLIFALMLAATPVMAQDQDQDTVLSCFFNTDGSSNHVVIIGRAGSVKLQWDGQPFNYGTAEMVKDRYLVVRQYGNRGTFTLVYDSSDQSAYGGTKFYDGRESKGPATCRWQ
jgi:redox-regulated HSP33 family molecular chaperone